MGRMGFHWSSKQLFLNSWKVAINKNSIQEETFSIFGDPKPGSKFSSPFKKKVSMCAHVRCKHDRDFLSFGISESQSGVESDVNSVVVQ